MNNESIYDIDSPENNPFNYMRLGRIIKVFDYDTVPKGGVISDGNIPYLSVAIQWLDRGGSIGDDTAPLSKTKLSYPHISQGWGLTYKPAIGDVVICGFRMEGYPVILGYHSVLLDSKVLKKYTKDSQLKYYFRPLIEGEYSWKSKQGAEWYLDRVGSLHLLTRDQSQVDNGTNPFTGATEAVVKDNLDVEVTLGKVYNNEGKDRTTLFTEEVLSSSGESIKFQIKDNKSGISITLDSVGNIDIVQPNDGKLTVNTGNISINAKNVDVVQTSGSKLIVSGGDGAEILGTQSLALKSELDALKSFVANFVTAYNAHTNAAYPLTTPFSGVAPTISGTQKLKGS